MKPVVGVFKSRSAAQSAAAKLVPLGIPNDKINILTPDITQTELAQLPTQAAEQPGMGKAMGATVGGAIGVAAASTLPALLGSLLVPGVGPILAIGLAGGVLGAVAGGGVGAAMGKLHHRRPSRRRIVRLRRRVAPRTLRDRKSTRLNSSHAHISYAV